MITFGGFGKISKPKSAIKNILLQSQSQRWSHEEARAGFPRRLEKSPTEKRKSWAIKGRQSWAGLGWSRGATAADEGRGIHFVPERRLFASFHV